MSINTWRRRPNNVTIACGSAYPGEAAGAESISCAAVVEAVMPYLHGGGMAAENLYNVDKA